MTPDLHQVWDYEVSYDGDVWTPMGHVFTSLESVRGWLRDRHRHAPVRIITRYVTDWEVVPDET